MKTSREHIPWSAFLNLADAAAETFNRHRRSPYLRHRSTAALRYLWATGTADERTTLACRVAVWHGCDKARVEKINSRVMARERERAAALAEVPE